MADGAYREFISKPEISFWVPIIVSSVTIALSFGVLLTRIALIEQNQQTQIALTKELVEQNKNQITNLYSRIGTIALQVNTLETRAGLK